MHGSAWPSHRGDGRLENSFVHPSFDACCAAPGSQISAGDVVVGLADAAGGAAGGGVISALISAEVDTENELVLVSPLVLVCDVDCGVFTAAGLGPVALERVCD
jgi:hypothetical protein